MCSGIDDERILRVLGMDRESEWHPAREALAGWSTGWGRVAADWTLSHAKGNRMGCSATQLTLYRRYAGRRLRGWHDVGGECSVVPPECTEIRLCVTHALGADWREGCGTRATTASPHG